MKIIKYKLPNEECEKVIECKTEEAFNISLIVAEKEAQENTIEVSGEFEPVEQSLEERTAALEEALTLLLEGATE